MLDSDRGARKRNYRTETGLFFSPVEETTPQDSVSVETQPMHQMGNSMGSPGTLGVNDNRRIPSLSPLAKENESISVFSWTRGNWKTMAKQMLLLLILQALVYLLVLGVDSLYRQWSEPEMRIHPVSKQPEVYSSELRGSVSKEGNWEGNSQKKREQWQWMRCEEGNGLQCYDGMHTPVQSVDSDRVKSATVLSVSHKKGQTGVDQWHAEVQDTKVEDDDSRFQVMVSVVMPCFGHIHHIQESIESVVKQTYKGWELLIVDDGSPDQCGAYAQSLKKQHWPQYDNIHILILNNNGGAAAARNTGISFAKGKWISCLDGDDTIRSDYFEEAMKLSTRDPNVNLIYSDQLYYRDEFKPENRFGDWIVPDYSAQRVLLEGPWPTMSLFRRTLWVISGGFEPQMPWGSEDWVFWISISRHALVPRKLHAFMVFYRFKETSKMRKKERYPEFLPIMHTLFPDLYTPAQLMKDHEVIGRTMHIDTMSYLRTKIMKQFKTKFMPYLWLGLVEEYKGDPGNAVRMYERCISMSKEALTRDESNSDVHLARVNWQCYWRMIRLCSNKMVKNDCIASNVADAITQLLKIRPDFQGQMVHFGHD